MGNSFDITLPMSWSQLTDPQLKLLFTFLAHNLSSAEIKTLCIIKWAKIRVIGQTENKKEYWVKAKNRLIFVIDFEPIV